MTIRRFPLWTLLGVVLVAALVVGSGILSSTPPTAAQRATAIESVVRCPSCEDLSVAESSAPTAVTVRAAVAQQIAEGRTDQQIQAYLVDRYGMSIVLDPPARGWSLLVWLLPVLGGILAVGVLAIVLVRRRGSADEEPGVAGPERHLGPAMTEDRRRFLQQSLADADAEYLAGDLSDHDYLTLRHRDMVRLAALPPSASVTTSASRAPAVAVDERTEGPTVAGPTAGTTAPADRSRSRPRSRRSWWFLGGAVAAFGAALILAVSLFATDRPPGQSVTGSVALTPSQQIEVTLAQAATDENRGQLGPAAQLYQSVLTDHPDNEVAVAQLGWLEFETGQQGSSASLIGDARSKLNRAVGLDPGDYAARLYLGTLLLQQDGNATGAVDQYRQFLDDGPPAAVLRQAAPEIRSAYQKAGLPAPPQVAAG